MRREQTVTLRVELSYNSILKDCDLFMDSLVIVSANTDNRS